jgi:hypothetical protein
LCNKIGKNVGKEAHIDLYLLLIELITTQHHVFHCKKNLPIRPKTQKNSMLFEFHLNSMPSLHNLIAPHLEIFAITTLSTNVHMKEWQQIGMNATKAKQ